MTKMELTLTCCGRTFKNNKFGRCRHRKQMEKQGVDCPLKKEQSGPKRKFDTPTKKAKAVAKVQKWREK